MWLALGLTFCLGELKKKEGMEHVSLRLHVLC